MGIFLLAATIYGLDAHIFAYLLWTLESCGQLWLPLDDQIIYLHVSCDASFGPSINGLKSILDSR